MTKKANELELINYKSERSIVTVNTLKIGVQHLLIFVPVVYHEDFGFIPCQITTD